MLHRDIKPGTYREAITLYEELQRERPGDDTLQDGFALTLCRFGVLRSGQRGGTEEAARLLERSRLLVGALVARHPDSPRLRYARADVCLQSYNCGVGDERRQAEAFRVTRETLDMLKKLAGRDRVSPRLRVRIGLNHDANGVIALRKKRLKDAVVEFGEARRLLAEVVRDNPGVDTYRAYLAVSCMRLGLALTDSGASEEAFGPLRGARDAFEH